MTAFKAKFGSQRAQSITKSICKFICKDLHPYSMVKNDGFHQMLATLEPRYKVPSRLHFAYNAEITFSVETRE